MENTTCSEFIKTVKDEYLEKVDVEEVVDEINAAGCPWWNVSCHLGNRGRHCTITVECMPNCN